MLNSATSNQAQAIVIGRDPGDSASVSVSGGSKVSVLGTAFIGYYNGATLVQGNIYLGLLGGAYGSLSVSGSNTSVNVEGSVTVATNNGSSGELSIGDGASVTGNYMTLASSGSTTGTVYISGTGTEVSLATTFQVGLNGTAYVEITSGALVTSSTLTIANGNGASAHVKVAGETTQVTLSKELWVGSGNSGLGTGRATMEIDGATVQVGGNAWIGGK